MHKSVKPELTLEQSEQMQTNLADNADRDDRDITGLREIFNKRAQITRIDNTTMSSTLRGTSHRTHVT